MTTSTCRLGRLATSTHRLERGRGVGVSRGERVPRCGLPRQHSCTLSARDVTHGAARGAGHRASFACQCQCRAGRASRRQVPGPRRQARAQRNTPSTARQGRAQHGRGSVAQTYASDGSSHRLKSSGVVGYCFLLQPAHPPRPGPVRQRCLQVKACANLKGSAARRQTTPCQRPQRAARGTMARVAPRRARKPLACAPVGFVGSVADGAGSVGGAAAVEEEELVQALGLCRKKKKPFNKRCVAVRSTSFVAARTVHCRYRAGLPSTWGSERNQENAVVFG